MHPSGLWRSCAVSKCPKMFPFCRAVLKWGRVKVIAIPVAPFPKILLWGWQEEPGKKYISKCYLRKSLGMTSHWQDTLSLTKCRKNPTESSPSLKAPEHSSQARLLIPGLGGERRERMEMKMSSVGKNIHYLKGFLMGKRGGKKGSDSLRPSLGSQTEMQPQ